MEIMKSPPEPQPVRPSQWRSDRAVDGLTGCFTALVWHLIILGKHPRLVTLGGCRLLDGLWRCYPVTSPRRLWRRPGAGCEWFGVHHLRSEGRTTLVIKALVVLSVGRLPPCPPLNEGGVRWLRG
uniref:Uncharacterized protein n=1 Tax=Oryza sativa subsp. japonica TaxID=39947 RepID=Q6EUI1_ORYSJ|nr:hypothetical protein [Oryza sativa Japonica Group]